MYNEQQYYCGHVKNRTHSIIFKFYFWTVSSIIPYVLLQLSSTRILVTVSFILHLISILLFGKSQSFSLTLYLFIFYSVYQLLFSGIEFLRFHDCYKNNKKITSFLLLQDKKEEPQRFIYFQFFFDRRKRFKICIWK